MVRLLILLAFLFTGLLPVYAQDSEVAAYRNIAAHDARLAHIGYRLSIANADFCSQTLPNMGWVLHDIAQYPDDENVTKAFRFPAPISVLKVIEGGPADRAGVKDGDGYIGLSSESATIKTISYGYTGEPNIPTVKFNDYQRLSGALAAINETLANLTGSKEQSIITVERDGEILKLPFALNTACASDYILDARSKVDAGANGKYVRITLGLSEFFSDDDEYAAAVAHELAHNILKHNIQLTAAKYDAGPLAGLGRNKRIRTIEEQADRLAIWLMANAGFDVAAGPKMIERLSKRKGRPVFSYRTHNKWKKRLGFMNQEIANLAAIAPDALGRRYPPLMKPLKTE